MRESALAQWQQVETVYQRRFDLIPNLVESVKGVMKQEQTIFDNLAEARSKYSGAVTPSDKALAAGQVETAFGRLLAIMENYPTLKSSETVQDLMVQLEGTENRISTERQRYNENVRNYTVATKTFPRSIIASMFGFESLNYFEAQSGAEVAPKVQL
jgi:LemA protein